MGTALLALQKEMGIFREQTEEPCIVRLDDFYER